MIDSDIEALVARDYRELGALEGDIWRQEVEIRTGRAKVRMLAGLQAGVIAISVVVSGSAGLAAATEKAQAEPASLFDPGAGLAPSSLLFGSHS